ncbi:TVP38/TMEM64 family protein [Zobellia barbeyronii]|uniref:TVP38/TMEM64 family membrane protein n=1 Tax=Zobellia barbeyronii TaxID=2748009 RepID=A0ABS5WGH1_9FLAO|nr:TVP38/TMEM64 family protein [Zobellia barbeyronii]MBT2162458.1 TVP38/TMEM64 family protein [Zobellia barbeyronii]
MSKGESTKNRNKSKWPAFLSVMIAVLLAIGYFTIPSIESFFNEAWQVLTSGNQKEVENWVAQFGAWGPIILIIAMIAQMFLIIVPSVMLMVASILAYGPIWGSIIILIAVFLASSVGYAIGKLLGRDQVQRIIGKKTEKKVSGFLEDYGFWAVIITRLNPFLSNDAISFVGGILRMGYWKFIGATLIGITPLILFIAILGKSTNSMKTGLLWGSLISLAIFLLYVWYDKKHHKQIG